MLFANSTYLFSCVIEIGVLMVFALITYSANEKRKADNPENKVFHPFSPWMTPFKPWIWVGQ